jgi:hypothetical protein
MRHTFWGMGQEEVQASMAPILGALGLKLAVLSDDEALARIRYRLPLRGNELRSWAWARLAHDVAGSP